MAVDVFLAFSRDIPGVQLPAQSELTDKYIAQNTNDPGYFVETKEHQFGIQRPASSGSGSSGAGGGKASLSELVVTKQVDQLTPHLLQVCGLGAQVPYVKVFTRRAGGTTKTLKPFLVHTLKQVQIKAVTWSCNDGEDVLEEHLTLAYGSLKMEYWMQKKDGTLTGTPLSGAWNQVTNSPSVEG